MSVLFIEIYINEEMLPKYTNFKSFSIFFPFLDKDIYLFIYANSTI